MMTISNLTPEGFPDMSRPDFSMSTKTPRYMIAQYMASRWRMETRNLGVVLWTPHHVTALFRGEDEEKPGTLLKKDMPEFLQGNPDYIFWLSTWRNILLSGRTLPFENEQLLPSDPLYPDALKTVSNEFFYFLEGGLLVDVSSTENAIVHLYETLILDPEDADDYEPSKERIDWVCSRLLRDTKLKDKRVYMPNYAYADVSFSFAIGSDKESPEGIYEEVPLPSGESGMQRSVYAAAYKYSKLDHVAKSECYSLIYVTDERKEREGARLNRCINHLKNESDVVNVANERERRELTSEWESIVAKENEQIASGLFANYKNE